MNDKISQEDRREYANLCAYIEFYVTYVMGIDPSDEVHPANARERILEKFGMSKALKGLKQAVSDSIQDMKDESPEYIAKFDAALREAGIQSFSEIRNRYAKYYRSIIARGKIDAVDEHYYVVGVLADVESPPSKEEREILEQMVARFERQMSPSE